MMPKLGIPVVLGLVGVAAVAVGCASSGRAAATSASCALTRQDSTLLAGGPLFRACMVDDTARALNLTGLRTDFRPQPVMGEQCFSAVVEFVVDPRGMPEDGTARVITSTHSNYANAVLAAVPQLRYQPARKAGVPVRQLVRLKQMAAVVVTASRVGGPPSRPPSSPPRC
ncbi:MAG: hypothetical protein WEE89_17870 [Gemmatimonadota bacterium]